MIVLDTTVLGYAVGSEHPLRAPCRRLLDAHARGLVAGATTIEVIQEFAHVRARRRSRADAVALARHAMAAFTLLISRPEDLGLGLVLFERYPGARSLRRGPGGRCPQPACEGAGLSRPGVRRRA